MKRRQFIKSSTGAALVAAGMHSQLGAQEGGGLANDRITVAVVGIRGRGGGLLNTFAGLPDVDVKYVCDVDESVRNSRAASVKQQSGKRPASINDFREALDDDSVDAIVLGTPDHWHALPTIMACQAGKDVYVEKPDGHNILEGETMVAAARKFKRVVQLLRSGTVRDAGADPRGDRLSARRQNRPHPVCKGLGKHSSGRHWALRRLQSSSRRGL